MKIDYAMNGTLAIGCNPTRVWGGVGVFMNWKLEIGNWKLETRYWKLGGGARKGAKNAKGMEGRPLGW